MHLVLFLCFLWQGRFGSPLAAPTLATFLYRATFAFDPRPRYGRLVISDTSLFHAGLRGFLKLCDTHGRAFRVLLQNALVRQVPLVQDVLQTIVGFSLGSFDQVTNLKTLLAKLNDALIVPLQDLTLSELQLLQVAPLLTHKCLLFPRLGINSLRQNPLLLLQVLKLLLQLLLLGLRLFGFLHTDAVVLSYRVKLAKACPELLQLVALLAAHLLCFPVFFFKLRQLLCQVGQALSRILDLLKNIWLTLLN